MDVQLITDLKNLDIPFNQQSVNRKAQDDFRYVATQLNLMVANDVDLLAVHLNGRKICEVLAVPLVSEKKVCQMPANLVKINDPKMYVAVVCYKDGKPVDVLMLESEMFAHQRKFVGFDKKANSYTVKIRDVGHASGQGYSFGSVISQLTSGGA